MLGTAEAFALGVSQGVDPAVLKSVFDTRVGGVRVPGGRHDARKVVRALLVLRRLQPGARPHGGRAGVPRLRGRLRHGAHAQGPAFGAGRGRGRGRARSDRREIFPRRAPSGDAAFRRGGAAAFPSSRGEVGRDTRRRRVEETTQKKQVPSAEHAVRVYGAAAARGYGGKDFGGVYEVLEKARGDAAALAEAIAEAGLER